MPRVNCRCGEVLSLPVDGPDRVVCPKCGAKIRVRRTLKAGDIDGFIRFACPCGRRLKVRVAEGAQAGKCPDCGRVVPVPKSSESLAPTDSDATTQELSAEELARLEEWARQRAGGAASAPAAAAKSEAGLRICPQCGRPVHLGASVCRQCGAAVPKR